MPAGIPVDGRKIRVLRERTKLMERDEFARRIGVTPYSVYEIEVRRQSTQLRTVKKIAKVLGVSPHDLIVEAEAENKEGVLAIA